MAGKRRTPIPIKGRRAKKPAKPPVTYSIADAARSVANKILGYTGATSLPGLQHDPHGALPGMTRLKQARILFLFSTAAKVGRDAAAQASRFAKKHLPLTDTAYDFEVVVSKPCWDAYSEAQRYALVYHELLHCGVTERDAWTIVPHDLEEFSAVVRHFGLWNDRTKQMAEQMRLFDRAATVRLASAASKS